MRVFVTSLGCRLNQGEMDALARELVQGGHQVVASPAEAELCILNSCAVTGVAAQKSRQALRRLHRENPAARLVVTGCYAELEPGELSGLPGVERVVGNQAKEDLARLVGPERAGSEPPPHPVAKPGTRTRALVKIQDGCDNACTYCIIHIARGPQRSRPPDQILEEVRALLAGGYREVVLTGVHIGAYGRDGGGGPDGPIPKGVDLWGLVARLLAQTDLARLRLSSIEPWDLPERAFRLWEDPRLCRHLHLPLQSGCDATLRRMGRPYTAAHFAGLVEGARAAIPDLAVTTDLIVGFPGETEEESAESLAFVQAMGFARVHVFPFSRRPGTPADQMPGQVESCVKAERARAVQAVAASSSRAFRQRFVGRTMSVLWESTRPGAAGPAWSGLTDNYLRVYAVGPALPEGVGLRNTLTPTFLRALAGDGLEGEIEAKESGG